MAQEASRKEEDLKQQAQMERDLKRAKEEEARLAEEVRRKKRKMKE